MNQILSTANKFILNHKLKVGGNLVKWFNSLYNIGNFFITLVWTLSESELSIREGSQWKWKI